VISRIAYSNQKLLICTTKLYLFHFLISKLKSKMQVSFVNIAPGLDWDWASLTKDPITRTTQIQMSTCLVSF
jgi:hypothetical protein